MKDGDCDGGLSLWEGVVKDKDDGILNFDHLSK